MGAGTGAGTLESVRGRKRLERAIEQDQFVFHYQPQISMLSGTTCGAEALIRWPQPDGTLVPPDQFIPLAESTGLIKRISVAMFHKLIEDLVIIHDTQPDLVMSFNLTAQDFESTLIIDVVRSGLERYGIPPHLLQVELTETSFINSSQSVRSNIQALLDLGVRMAMDDFGTGYSSIDVLSQWEFSAVKLDHGLIQRMLTSERSTTIVQSSINMAHQLGIEVVAEGIESAALYDFLLNAGCTEAQGFWLARPLSLSGLLSFLETDQRWSGMPIGLIHMAQHDHIMWRRSLVEQVMARTFAAPDSTSVCVVNAEMDHTRCKLGQWYYGIGQEYRGVPSFDALDAPHQELHRVGQQLAEAVRTHATREEVTALLRSLTSKSGEVMALLQELENYALLHRQTAMASAQN